MAEKISALAMDREKIIRLIMVAGIVLVLDQLTKLLILKYLYLHQEIPVIEGLFNIVSVRNPGGAFGFLAGHSTLVRMIVFLVVSLFAVVAVLYFYMSTPKELKWLSSAFAMILGGAAGNLVDRFRFGEVVDFLDVYIKYFDYHWPAFNVADSAITIGMAIFIWHVVLGKIPD